ncbi:MAG TPA: DUF4169 family protein [Rhizomicrobium sp.]|nr:DUF4169 family protein [Rhizomicrobium sp.]
MAEIINLKRARKAKNRAEKDKTAQANRVAHGTPKAVKKLAEAQADKADQRLSGHKLEKTPDDNRSVRESECDQK